MSLSPELESVLGALQFGAHAITEDLLAGSRNFADLCGRAHFFFTDEGFWFCTVVRFVVGFAATSQMAATKYSIPRSAMPDVAKPRDGGVRRRVHGRFSHRGRFDRWRTGEAIGAQATLTVFGSPVLLGQPAFSIVRVVMKAREKQTAAADCKVRAVGQAGFTKI